MKRLGLIFALTFGTVSAADSSHDAPLEILNNSVHAFLRTDTLIDRTLYTTPANQLLQHTHAYDHTLQVFTHSRHVHDVKMSPTDELHFRLTGRRRLWGLLPGPFIGYMTVKPDYSRQGVGKLVPAHAAKLRESSARCAETSGRALADCVEANTDAANKASFDLVWIIEGPSGYKWVAQGGKNDSDVSAAIAATGKQPSHDLAKKNASKIEYRLETATGEFDFFIRRFHVVPKGGAPNGHGYELSIGSRVVVCENVYDSGKGTALPACTSQNH